ncbi:bifunctional diacylglycerol diphosphate phosphatase/phosphatidate phosphatase [Aspergillus brasiliensis]|uniref:Bifunctional diacylglycerol diphosphate phosphatase/phosphatidate phosphatase n=1 Tax=Aspergillus brasiliensis TaxID=319629 RepID=A0A9W5YL14_9EURO|nr:bifunctional diacylglycerol diphosphate phosphatase/phosphatidate phosphatase [Aspergillus brasiliensis]
MVKPQIYQLSVAAAFDGLSPQEKLYAHHMASCDGNWEQLATKTDVSVQELDKFLDYAATFLSNVGNYFGSGDQKFTPDVSEEFLIALATGSPSASEILEQIKDSMLCPLPSSLGRPGPFTQSSYYLGEDGLESSEDVTAKPPLDPFTGKPVESWYRAGQTWTGVFNDLATTVDECRAELVGAYLIDDLDILRIFGYTDQSEVQPDDIAYNMYLQLGVDGLRGLENYDPTTNKWGQAHSRAHYAIFRYLLRDSGGLYTVIKDVEKNNLTVKVDRSRVISHGKPSLGRMLLKLHIYRCTADVSNCRAFYEDLSHVDNEALEWRDIVVSKNDPPLVFSQANTYLVGHDVRLKEYEPTARGVVQSWAERSIV